MEAFYFTTFSHIYLNLVNIYARYFNGTDWDPIATDISNNPAQYAYIPQIAFDASGHALAVWYENNATNNTNIYARYFNGTWSATATNISNNAAQNAEYPQIAFDTTGNALAVWSEYNNATSQANIYARYFNGTDWDPIATDISNNPAQYAYSCQIAFDTTGNALAVWPENNNTVYARRYKPPTIPESKNANCITTNNRISNINTTLKTGTGIYGDERYNNFSQNIAAWCDLAYSASITNVQSGYTGSTFMYNIALPS